MAVSGGDKTFLFTLIMRMGSLENSALYWCLLEFPSCTDSRFWLLFPAPCVLSHSVLPDTFANPWMEDCQVPLSMGFPSQGYWSGLPCPSLGNLHDHRMEPTSLASPALQVDSLPVESSEKPTPWGDTKAKCHITSMKQNPWSEDNFSLLYTTFNLF